MAKKKSASGRTNKPGAATKKPARTTAAAAATPVRPTDVGQPPKAPKAADATASTASQGPGDGAATPQAAPRLPFRRPQSLNFAGVGRNDICPCGSGKRFKNCHGH